MFKPRQLKKTDIWAAAEKFRQEQVTPPELVPVPILEIVEIQYGIQPIPVALLREKGDIDGFLSRDLRKIYIDETIYNDERYENRLRFTYAHEIGHLALHKDEIQAAEFDSPAQWVQFRDQMPDEDLKWFEWQAYEFGGRLLVPKDRLIAEIESKREMIQRANESLGDNQNDLLIEYVAHSVSKAFQVSDQVIIRRIRSESIWDEVQL